MWKNKMPITGKKVIKKETKIDRPAVTNTNIL